MKATSAKTLSLQFMEQNPLEAIGIKEFSSDAVHVNRAFREMFGLSDVRCLDDIITPLFSDLRKKNLFIERISEIDNSLINKPIRTTIKETNYHIFIYHDIAKKITYIHARNMKEIDELSYQLSEFAEGLVKNIYELEVSQRKLLKSKDRLDRQVKASSELGLTVLKSMSDLQSVLMRFTEIAASTIGVERCGIWMLKETGKKLVCYDQFTSTEIMHVSDIEFTDVQVPGIFESIREQRIIDIGDALESALGKDIVEDYLRPKNIRSLIIASIILKGEAVGVVMFEHAGEIREWEEDEKGFAVIFADQVARILSEEERKKLELQLLQSQKMESIGTLAGGLAHDFNNVLGGIVGIISLMKSECESLDREVLKNYISIMDEAATRATDMVQQLLGLARKHDLTFVTVDLNAIINAVIKICTNTFDKSVNLITLYQQEPAIVNGDITQIQQMILNLCINGYHAMTLMRKEGETIGGTLRIELKKARADQTFCEVHPGAKDGYYWVITVRDDGIGINEEIMPKIFEPFFTTKKDGQIKGTGLGLSMVYSIAHELGGFITVYSEVGQGTEFNIYLPVFEDHLPAPAEKKEELISGTGTVLVVDDEELMRKVAKRILEKCGYTVLLAKDGEEGVEVFRVHWGDIAGVLLDMAMPKKSGRETFFEMKKIDPHVKVLLASGYRHDERLEELIESGVKGFIKKPYTLIDLSGEIRRIIKGQ